MGTPGRLLALFFAVAAAVGGGPIAAPAAPAGAQVLPDDPRLGLIYDGLRRATADSPCQGAFEAYIDTWVGPGMRQLLCTHGPDPAPDGVDVRENREPDSAAAVPLPSGATAVAEPAPPPCYGDGGEGFRVQLLYARAASAADRFDSYSSSFNAWAARLDKVVDDSAAETGGTRHVRLVTDRACNPVIGRVTLSSGAMSNFTTMVSELRSQGYTRTDRKYLVWADTNVYCGMSQIWVDDSADATPGRNANNGHPQVPGTVGRIDNGCWGRPELTEAHELAHLLGGVQPSAPNATPGYHCTDESDRVCYADGSGGATVRQACPTWHEALYDCNHDDYFSTAPFPGSYLGTHWNTASSAFLSGQAPPTPGGPTTTVPPPPPATTTVPPPPPTTTTTPPTSTPPTSTPPTSSPPTTSPPPATTPPPPPAGGAPSAPQALSASQPAVGSGVQLAWQRPASGTVTGYRVYRGTTPTDQTLLAALPDVMGFNDASAGRSLYFYRVTAVNGAGESPSSALTGMIGKAPTAAGAVREDVDRRITITGNRLAPPWARRWA